MRKTLMLVMATTMALVLTGTAEAAPARDHQGPTITITTPVAGATYQLNQVVNANYTCSDPSGVASCAGPVANGAAINTSTSGSKSFRVNATDASSRHNASNKTVNYTVAAAPPPKVQCNDGVDNDADGLIDFPQDPGCTSATDTTESPNPPPAQCSDGIDNDGDGFVDYPQDPGCTSASDTTESPNPPPPPQCNNGVDDDGDGKIDFPNDPGCSSATDTTESPDPPPPPSCPNGYVALSYDDGPTTMTQQYVDTLVAHGAKATFFLLGKQMNAFPSLALYEKNAGMILGDHTMTHPDLTSLSNSQAKAELLNQKNLAQSQTGFTEYLSRPPYGYSNGPVFDLQESLGLRETTWSLDTNDWQEPPTQSIIDRALNGADGNHVVHDQDIILMHDGYPNTLAAMVPIINGLHNRGLCPGQIVPSWDNPVYTPWGTPIFVNVVKF